MFLEKYFKVLKILKTVSSGDVFDRQGSGQKLFSHFIKSDFYNRLSDCFVVKLL